MPNNHWQKYAVRGATAATVAGAIWLARRKRARVDAHAGLIDWNRTRAVALRVCRHGRTAYPVNASIQERYADFVAQSTAHIAKYVGHELTIPAEAVKVVDPSEWVDVNLTNFRALFQRLDPVLNRASDDETVGSYVLDEAKRWFLSGQIGLVLGVMSRRVLGQYDLSFAQTAEAPSDGKIYFLERNIEELGRKLDLPGAEFRLWIALHETTHAFEFEAHPWVRGYMAELMNRYVATFEQDLADNVAKSMLVQILQRVTTNLHRRRVDPDLKGLELMMSEEQQAIFRQLQALMCVLEGYSNHVMDHLGESLLPHYQDLKSRFEARKNQRTPAERIFARTNGLDLKYEQYRIGEQFVAEVIQRAGTAGIKRMWESPAQLPTLREIRDPSLWIKRVLLSEANNG